MRVSVGHVIRQDGRAVRRGANHLIHCSQHPYLPVDSEALERSSLKLVLD
ncbi:protein of unknown function [Streptomyces murinus]